MKPVVFHPEARDEVENAAARYEVQQPGLGRDFRCEFESALERIRANPQMYAVVGGEFRACLLRRFPYIIFYLDLEDRIWVSAVAHPSRRPGYGRKRRSD